MKTTLNILLFIGLTILMTMNSLTIFEYLILIFLFITLPQIEFKINIEHEK